MKTRSGRARSSRPAEPGSPRPQHREQLARLFRDVDGSSDPGFEELLEKTSLLSLAAGDVVFRPGDPCRAFIVLLEGGIRVQLTAASGREVSLYRIGPNGTCMLTTSCLLSRDTYPATAIVEEETVAAAIPLDVFREALDRSPRFRQRVFEGFSARLSGIIGRIEEVALTSIDTRLARALLELHERHAPQVTHQQLAVELGTAREVVSRHLKRFEAKQWIRLGRGRIEIVDEAGLSRIAAATIGD